MKIYHRTYCCPFQKRAATTTTTKNFRFISRDRDLSGKCLSFSCHSSLPFNRDFAFGAFKKFYHDYVWLFFSPAIDEN
jgi:hypothetical protein